MFCAPRMSEPFSSSPSPGFGSTPLITRQATSTVSVVATAPGLGVCRWTTYPVVQARGSSELSTNPKWARMVAAVVADDAEAAGDDVGIGDQHLLDAVQPRDRDLVQDVEVAHQRAEAGAGVVHQLLQRVRRVGRVDHEAAQVGVDGDEGVGDQPEVGGPLLDGRAVVVLGLQDRLAVGDQLQRLRQRLLGPGEQQVAVVDQPAEVVPGAVEGLPELVDDDPQVLLVDRADQLCRG